MIPKKYIGFGTRLTENNSYEFPEVINLSQNFYNGLDDTRHHGTIGNSNFAYSIEVPAKSITGAFNNLRSIMVKLKYPTFAKKFLFNNFQIIKISDFGNQSLTDGLYDFMVKLYINGKKVPQDSIGIIRRYSSKEAFLLLERLAYTDSVFTSPTNICYVVERIIRGVNPTIGSLTYNKNVRVWRIPDVIYRLTSHIIYSDRDSENYVTKLSDLFFQVFNDDRFDLLYDGEKINSRFFSSLFTTRFVENVIQLVRDTQATSENTATSLTRGQTKRNSDDPSLNGYSSFDYYKYLYEVLYENNNINYESVINENRSENIIALLETLGFTSEEAKKLSMRDRLALPEYHIFESGAKPTLSSIGANNIFDIEVYKYTNSLFLARLPISETNGYTVNSSGVITVSNASNGYEIIVKHNNKLHLYGCAKVNITIPNLRYMLKDRGIYAYNFANSNICNNEFYDVNGLLLNTTSLASSNQVTFRMVDLEISKDEELEEGSITYTAPSTNVFADEEITTIHTGIGSKAISGFPVSIMQDPMMIYAGPNKIVIGSDSYVIYRDEDPINHSSEEIKMSDIISSSQQSEYETLTTQIDTIKNNVINSIFNNQKTKDIERNITVLRENMTEMTTEKLSGISGDKLQFTEEFVPSVIRTDFSNQVAENKYVIVMECKCNKANDKIMTINYEYQHYNRDREVVYLPTYVSQLDSEYKVIVYYVFINVTTDSNDKIINTAFETAAITDSYII